MLGNISFQKKMFMYYSCFIIVLLTCLILISNSYMSSILRSQSAKNMEQSIDKISSLLDASVLEIDRMCMQVYFNNDIQDIMQEALEFGKDSGNYFDYNIQSSKKIRNILVSYNFYKLFDRKITLFNNNLSYISSGAYPATFTGLQESLKDSSWINELAVYQDKFIILPPHMDWWVKDKRDLKISLIRNLMNTFNTANKHLGYIEVQLPYQEIEKLCSSYNGQDLDIVILNEKGDAIYPYQRYDTGELSFYNLLKGKNGAVVEFPASGIRNLVYTKHSEYTNWTVILTQPETTFMSPVNLFRNIFLIAGILFALASLSILYLISKYLTTPIREMRKQLNALSLENFSIVLNDKTNNEILMFHDVFNRTLNRMKESMEQTIEAKENEARAQFLALQAQMNPHFIYNVLMVISSAGFELGSRKIVMICTQLADMMKYIATEDSMSITIKDELSHTANYLELLKWRFADQLHYELFVEEGLHGIEVPKLIVQPLVENSYNHGFSGKRPPWHLSIRGWLEKGLWTLEIEDDGVGFCEGELMEIKHQISQYRSEFQKGKAPYGLSIGGMGLSNIFCRLHMLYKDKLIFEINSEPGIRTSVRIGGPYKINESSNG